MVPPQLSGGVDAVPDPPPHAAGDQVGDRRPRDTGRDGVRRGEHAAVPLRGGEE